MTTTPLTLLPATACENDDHRFAGHCTPECAWLVQAMAGDNYSDDMIYGDYLGGESSIDWSGCHRGPVEPEEVIRYDEGSRAVVIDQFHPEGCECDYHLEECGISITFGPRHDPYGATCEVIGNHVMRNGQRIHFQQGCPIGGDPDVKFRWLGGGRAAGDALSFQILTD